MGELTPSFGSPLLSLFDRFRSVLPTRDAGGEVFDVLVAKLFSRFRRAYVGVAHGAPAVGNYQGGLVIGEEARKLAFAGVEIDGSGDVARTP